MTKRMLINLSEPEECRVAIVDQGDLEEIYVERRTEGAQWGNIYKGRVVNVEPAIQAAFVEIGEKTRGFLHVTDICPAAIGQGTNGKRSSRRIQDYVTRGQEIVAQISREGIGDKGPTLTTYLSIPGRYVVLMPHIKKSGVSRKIEDSARRKSLRKMLHELNADGEMGFIVRTAGADLVSDDLRKDMDYLRHLWRRIEDRSARVAAVSTLYEEGDLVIRTIRDIYSSEIDEILIDSEVGFDKARRFLDLIRPEETERVRFYQETEPLFYRFQVEEKLDKIFEKRVALPSGGSIVIEPTEALVAIDVNSGRSTGHEDIEETALHTNLEATEAICRQLRLRDLGGVIVIDFIDMREAKNRRALEEAVGERLRRDRARTRMTRVSEFGIVQLTRQRLGPSIKSTTHEACPSCEGRGWTKSVASVGLDLVRAVQRGAGVRRKMGRVERIEARLNPLITVQVQNRERQALARLEKEHRIVVEIDSDPSVGVGEVEVSYFSANGAPVRIK